MSGSAGGDWLDDTYWYVPTAYLPALLAINTGQPRVVTVSDQMVWHIDDDTSGYITGISATNIGFGWSYMLIVGSVTPDGSVKFSFSPLGSANPNDPSTRAITIGDGTLNSPNGTVTGASFLMQMTSGTVAAGAFAARCPSRDLWLSPDRAVCAGDVLIPVKYLINGHSIAQVAVNEIPYWHVELPRHDVILAHGLPVESFLDTGNRQAFANGGGLAALFPDFAPLAWEGLGALPLVVTGPAVTKLRRRIEARARRLSRAV